MFVGWEGVGVCSYLLVSFWFTRIAANQSSLSAFLTNRVGDCFLTIGMFAILWSFGMKMIRRITESGIITIHAEDVESNVVSKTITPSYSRTDEVTADSLGNYLAGLIEGDGHIAVHNSDTIGKAYRPKIIIVFNVNDKPLAEKIKSFLNVGKVIDRSKYGHVLLQILAKDEVLKIINIINGKMRTPKIEALHRAIVYINEKDNTKIPLLDIDNSPLDSNSWLAGFSDADANFSITVYDRKKNKNIIRTNVQTFFRIEVKQNYSNKATNEGSMFNIMSHIAGFFTVNLYTRTRTKEDKVYYSFMAIAHNSRSHDIVRSYFDRFPLFSSKYLNYKDWCRVQDLHRGKLSKDNLSSIKTIKSQFNNKRIVYNFSHLDKFPY
jgi:hypothetical protein